MSQSRFAALAALPHRARELLLALPTHCRNARDALRDNPAALWEHPAARIALWIILGALLLGGTGWLVRSLTPPALDDAARRAPTAILHVACTAPECRHYFTTQQPLNFSAWPMTCPKCQQPTAYRATLCPKCRQWFAPAPGPPAACPHCVARAAPPPRPERERPTDPDDAEDGW